MKRYWVPALERADQILTLIAYEPARNRLIDLSKQLGINKSSMFTLLNTMESLGWIVKEKDDTYSLGSSFGALGAAYFRQFNLLKFFHVEAPASTHRVGETIQFAVLEGRDIIYLAKEESPAPIRVAADPGMRFPAHATSLGKALLTQYSYEQLKQLFPEPLLEAKTPHTITQLDQLWLQLQQTYEQGYAIDEQEAVSGFFCIAAPILNHRNEIIAAVSFTMMEAAWLDKFELAKEEIVSLARRLSQRAGAMIL
jgi:IclR family KDG regulon transcriptional repressor